MLTDWGPWVDTGRLGPQLFPKLTSARLEDMVAAFSLHNELAVLATQHCPTDRRCFHAALYDAMAAALLLAAFARAHEFAALTLPQLLALSTLDGARRDEFAQRMLF
jgi:DNA polymerase-3 subunit epsilon